MIALMSSSLAELPTEKKIKMGANVDTQKGGIEDVDYEGAGFAPDRSPSQRLAALKLANAVRSQRAVLKRDLKAGRVRIDQLLEDPPECVQSAKVVDIMLAVPRFGRVKVSKVLQRCRVSPSKTVAGLSERQRSDLIDALRRP